MNIGFVSTRLAGHDGVTLETAKWAEVLRRQGHQVFYCAGELDPDGPPGMLIPAAHFAAEENLWIRQHTYNTTVAHPDLRPRIERLKATIKPRLEQFIDDYGIDLLIPQNIFAVPLQIPLALALAEIIAETNIATIAHNHDYYWERTAYSINCVQDVLDSLFPPNLPSITHVAINSPAVTDLKRRRGIDSVAVPNVFDYETPAPAIDDYNADFRSAIGLSDEDFYILQPVRIIRRKGLELAIETVARLNDPHCKMVFTHVDDLEQEYLDELQAQAEACEVDLRLVTDQIGVERGMRDGKKVYTLWDAYVHADFVMYPSLYEGFGNALLEAMYFKKPVLINRYSVYKADIAPLKFQFVEIDGAVTDETVAQVRDILDHPEKGLAMAEHNYQVALEHYSYTALGRMLAPLVAAKSQA